MRHDRSDGRRGGDVCVYVNERLPIIHLKKLENHDNETLWLLINPHRLPRYLNLIILGVVYHPPGNVDKALLAHLAESLDYALSTNPGAGVVLTGDFNQFRHSIMQLFNLKNVVKSATNIFDSRMLRKE